MTEIEKWERITKNRRFLHYLVKQKFVCAGGCEHHFKIEDKVGKTHWTHPKYPIYEHTNTKEGGVKRPHIIKDINRVMCSECHAKRHDYKWGFRKMRK